MAISELIYNKLKNQLNKAKEREKEALAHLAQVDKSDAKENAGYDDAKEAVKLATQEVSKLESQLDQDVIKFNNSNIIVEGDLIEITPKEELEVFKKGVYLLSSYGNILLDRVISTEAELGRALINKPSPATVMVKGNVYTVVKIKDQAIREDFAKNEGSISELFKDII